MGRLAGLGATVATVAAIVLAGCGGGGSSADVCANADGALSAARFVFVQTPGSGKRVSSGFHVRGCSSTYEANVTWRLRARDGHTLAHGFAQGGNLGPGPFAFMVRYAVDRRQVGHLEVGGDGGASPPEGVPPAKDVVPLVLEP